MKKIKANSNFETRFGDVWPEAILVVDSINIDVLKRTVQFQVDIYKDEAAREAGKTSYEETFFMRPEDFAGNITLTQPISTLPSQLENYALTLSQKEYADPDNPTDVLIYPDFE
jgi:hypothetical protein